jgi:prepilin-type processing-associated H-X9-DG protein
VTDYMPAVYTDIDPSTGIQNPQKRKAGALRLGGTQTAKITDGLSRTIAIVEDAGRSFETMFPNTQSAYGDPVFSNGIALVWDGAKQVQYTQWLAWKQLNYGGLAPGDTPTPSGHRVLNRWADPACAGGISGQPNHTAANKVPPINGNRSPWGGPPTCLWSQTNCGPNEEIWSWHTTGANVLHCDGSVRSISSEIDPKVLRMLITADEQDIYDDKAVPN